jgi:glucosamine-6-phosphate deaminase
MQHDTLERREPMSEFTFAPGTAVPFQDKAEIERCRAIKREDIDKHPNPDFRIHVVPDDMIEHIWITDLFHRLMLSDQQDERVVLILPNPAPTYRKVAYLVNRFRVNCRNVVAFAMDEYADEDGNVAPEDWQFGFTYAMLHNFYYAIDEDLRPPRDQMINFTTQNVNDFSKMLTDAGEADICYSGPGWTGHLAFIEPDAPEFDAPLEEWKQMGARICTLSPFTLAQNSLHGSFGQAGDLSAVPPKAATIGPRDVIASKNRIDMHALFVDNSDSSWQRLITRLCLHGPVTPRVPTSIHQELRTDCYVSEKSAENIEPRWHKAY